MPEILRNRVGISSYLAPTGPLSDKESFDALRTEIRRCIEAHETHIVIDLKQVPSVNSQILEILLDTRDHLILIAGTLSLINTNAVVLDALRITNVHSYLNLLDEGINEQLKTTSSSNEFTGKRLGDMLIDENLVAEDKIDQAFKLQESTGKRMGQILVEKGWLEEANLLRLLSLQLNVPFVKLRMGLSDPEVTPIINKEVARRLKVLPLFKVRNELTLATCDPQAFPVLDEIKQLTGCSVRPVLARREEILYELKDSASTSFNFDEYIGELEEDFELVDNSIPDDFTTIDEMAGDSPVINLINVIIQRAIGDGASDIHIEPSQAKSRIRLRIDGVLYELMTPALEMHPALVSRLKVMANLDIAERRLPQDGRIQVSTQGKVVDLRFSSLPGIFGEKIVLRVLDKSENLLDIEKLGMSGANKSSFIDLINRNHGLVLVTGPTGSGKTTSLYAAINYLNSIEKSIVTIEDPVEYQLDIVNQNQVKESVGLDFPTMLKHVLRQDPDIVMVGEIRDRETAHIAVQSALTGHLVLSTLHTNESVGTINRLLNMGIEPFLLSSALSGVIAQRLIRRVCGECKTMFTAPPTLVQRFGWDNQHPIKLAKGRGCPACYDSGYKGRLAIYEILKSDSALQRLMTSNPTQEQLNEYVSLSGMKTLYDDGLEHVLQGETTLDEVDRIITLN